MTTFIKREYKKISFMLLVLGLFSILPYMARAGDSTIPSKMNYQARLKENGTPYTGTKNMTFKIYDQATGGTQLPSGSAWTETLVGVTFNNGLSSGVVIGSVVPIPQDIFNSTSERYLEVTIGSDTLTPREPLFSVPYAFTANKLDGVDTSTAAAATSIYVSDASGYLPPNTVTSAVIVNESITSADILNSTIVNDDLNASAGIAVTKLSDGSIDNTEFGYLNNTNSNLQGQIDDITGGGAGFLVSSPTASQIISPDTGYNITPLSIETITGQTQPAFNVKAGDSSWEVKVSTTGNLVLTSNLTIDGVDLSVFAVSSTGVHGITGTLVGTNDTQTLTNKTISSSSIDDTNSINADSIDAGTVADGRLSANVSKLGASIEGGEIASRTIGYLNIKANDITAGELASGSVAADEIATGAVEADELASDAVTTVKIEDGAVTYAKLGDAAVSNGKIQDYAITAVKIDTSAVTSDKLDDRAVTVGKIGQNAVTSFEIAAGSVTAVELQDSAVETAKIDDYAVTTIKIDTGAVTSDKIADSSVTSIKIAQNSISNYQIASDTITTAEVKNGTLINEDISASAQISIDKLGDGTISSTEFGYLNNAGSNLQDQLDTKIDESPSSAQTILPTANITPLIIQAKSSGYTADILKLKNGAGDDKITVTVDGNLVADTGVTLDGVDVSEHVITSHTVHGVTGYLVGTTDTQTLTNKTMSTSSSWEGDAIGDSYIVATITRDSELVAHTGAISAVHGTTGTVVGTGGVQTLTNKTLNVSTLTATMIDDTNYIEAGAVKSGTVADARLSANVTKLGSTIEGSEITDESIGEVDLANLAVSSRTIANSAVKTTHILNNNVTWAKLAQPCITVDNVNDNAIETDKIKDYQITSVKIATGAVASWNILNSAIIDEDISASADISPTKIDAGGVSISTSEYSYLNGVTSNIQNQIDTTVLDGVSLTPESEQTIEAQADIIPLVVKGDASQTAALLTLRNSGDTNLASFDSSGNLIFDTTQTVDGVDVSAHAGASSDVHGVTGAVVGESDSQTLTNKTMSTNSSWAGDTIGTSYIDSVITRDTELAAHSTTTFNVHGVTGDIVGTSDSQTVYNKTITTSTISYGVSIASYASVSAYAIKEGTIANARLDSSVSLLGQSITTDEIGLGQVTDTNIGSNAVGSDELKDNSVTSAELADDSVWENNIGTGAVRTDNLYAQAVASHTIKNDAVLTQHILDHTIGSADIAQSAVTSYHILNGTIQGEDFASNSIGTDNIQPNVISYIEVFGGDSYSQDGGTVTLKAGTNVEITDDGGDIKISATGAVASVAASSGMYKLEPSAGNFAFFVGAGDGMSVLADSVTVNQGFGFAWTNTHDFSAQQNFNYASGAPFTVSSNAVVSNLNADLLDGNTAGNASGNIPISNGEINTNLNAHYVSSATVNDSATSTTALWTSAKSTQTFIIKDSAIDQNVYSRIVFQENGIGDNRPFFVYSSTKVTNLNVDYVDGASVDDSGGPADDVLWTSQKATSTFLAKTGVVTVDGYMVFDNTFTISSSLLIANLNAEKFAGKAISTSSNTVGNSYVWTSDVVNDNFLKKSSNQDVDGILTFKQEFEMDPGATAVCTRLNADRVDGATIDDNASASTSVLWTSAKVYDAFISTGGGTVLGDINMSENEIINIGTNGTSFTDTGGLTLQDTLDMSSKRIINIGTLNSNFTTEGGLVLNDDFQIAAGSATIDAGNLSITSTGISTANNAATLYLKNWATSGTRNVFVAEYASDQAIVGMGGYNTSETSYVFGNAVDGGGGDATKKFRLLGLATEGNGSANDKYFLASTGTFYTSGRDVTFELSDTDNDRTFHIENTQSSRDVHLNVDGSGTFGEDMTLTAGVLTAGGTGTNTFAGNLTVNGTSTSTFKGPVFINTTSLNDNQPLFTVLYDAATDSEFSIDKEGNVKLIGDPPGGVNYNDGVFYINTFNSDAGDTIFGIADQGSEILRLDKEGDLSVAGDLSLGGQMEFQGNANSVIENGTLYLNPQTNGGSNNNYVFGVSTGSTGGESYKIMSLEYDGDFWVNGQISAGGGFNFSGSGLDNIDYVKYEDESIDIMDSESFVMKIIKIDDGTPNIADGNDGWYAVYAP